MKTSNFLFCILIIAVGFSCKKPKESKVCNTSYLALYREANDFFTLTELNASGISIGASQYPKIRDNNSLVYNKKDHCFYSVQVDSKSVLLLYRFDVKNKATSIINGTQFKDHYPEDWTLAYNSVVDKFYLQYFERHGNRHDLDAVFELSISDSIFTLNEITLLKPYHLSGTINVDEHTGEMYFQSSPKKYLPGANIVTEVPFLTNNVLFQLYNPNDDMLYGINYEIQPSRMELWKYDLNKGTGTLVTNLYSKINGASYATFNTCDNQYIIQYFDSVYCIDVNTGAIVKQFNTDKVYTHLTYIPE